jgi:hypothetical protein
MFFNVRAVSQGQFATWLQTQQALVKAKPSSVPKLPSGVGGGTSSTNSPGNNTGSDLYGD